MNKRILGRDILPEEIQRNIIRMAKYGNSGHIGSSLSIVHIVSVIYSRFLRINWEAPEEDGRDIFALSKGHGVMALYACFKELQWISEEQIKNYFSPENKLKGLGSVHVPGIEVSGGSLGQGLPVAVGMAKASKLKGDDCRIFCVVGDGEINEGSIWESMLFASHHKLNNLIVIVDQNDLQAMGLTIDIINMVNIKEKFTSFGFETKIANGHNSEELISSLETLINSKNQTPKAIIAKTVKGKGISFIENDNIWHYKKLTTEEYLTASKELGI